MIKKTKKTPLPTREQLLTFINESPTRVSKREIARAFQLKGEQRIWLKNTLKELEAEGTIARGRKKRVGSKSKLPPVLPCEVQQGLNADGEPLLSPLDNDYDPAPEIVLDDKRAATLAPGARVLVKVRREKDGHYIAKILKKLDDRSYEVVGLIHISKHQAYLTPCTRGNERSFPIRNAPADLAEEELVLADIIQGKREAKIKERLGQSHDPRSISLISIYNHKIPHTFPTPVLTESKKMAKLPPIGNREDLRHLPLVTIDGETARDFDDAVWAQHTDDNGWHLIVAIADVAYYVRPNSALDREAYERGNSVYFPDRVVPMLPEELSNNMCSLRPDEDRAALAVHMWLDNKGRLKSHRFERALIKSKARLTYAQVEHAIHGNPDKDTKPLMKDVIEPLYGAFTELKKAREFRGTLDLDIPEQEIIFNQQGQLEDIVPVARFEAHMLIEEFMILANVAAAQQLEQRRAPVVYRIHESPSEEKVAAFREVIKGLGLSFPKGQVILPKSFSQVLEASKDTEHHSLVSELALRSQMQARYDPQNLGHFGLNLTRYAHFTSPIRRYADLIIHRSLIRTLSLGEGGLTGDEDLDQIAQHISQTDRRAEAAEREARERYITTYLENRVHEEFKGRIRGVVNFGLFVELEGLCVDGLVPMTLLPNDYYIFDETKHQLIGRKSRQVFTLGDPVLVRLHDVNSLTNSITLEMVMDNAPKKRSILAKKKTVKKKKPMRKPKKK